MRLTVALMAAMIAGPCAGADLFSGAYFCADEFGGGITWNEAAKTWESTMFFPRGKFVVTLKYSSETDFYGEKVPAYVVNVTESGEKDGWPCLADSGPALVNAGNYLMCSTLGTRYVFNMKNLRYTSAYQIGYTSGEDNRDNTPSMMGGTCTKIN